MRFWPYIGALIGAFCLFPGSSPAEEPRVIVQRYAASQVAVQDDLKKILAQAKLPENAIHFSFTEAPSAQVQIVCAEEALSSIELQIKAPANEWSSTFYYGLQKIGFLFPHPRIQVTPNAEQMQLSCNQIYHWQPRFAYRGFHLHTMHPNEWLHGFLMGDKEIARDTLRWLARNQQNVVELALLGEHADVIATNLNDLIDYAHELGISIGADVSFTLAQQHAYRLVNGGIVNKIREMFGGSTDILKDSLENLAQHLNADYFGFELGSSEFTPTSPEKTIEWLNLTQSILQKYKKSVMAKAHCSVGQNSKEYGNFNFISQFANKNIGVEPHTVMFYALRDPHTPVYNRKNFSDIFDFMRSQVSERAVWYYPETSYFIAMDIDVPIFLTDYLVARSQDMDDVEKIGVQGHINFSTGHELGYWMMDWTVALLNNAEYRGNPLIGIQLLGENSAAWRAIIDYQSKYFKENSLIEEISSSNLGDEIGLIARVFNRTLLRELRERPEVLRERIKILTKAVADQPRLDIVKDPELQGYLQITWLRVAHALHIRKALFLETQNKRESDDWKKELEQAKLIRLQAQAIMDKMKTNFNRYPEAKIFERQDNLSSYSFGYGWTAQNLHFWEREEQMIAQNQFHWWFMNIYSIAKTMRF